MNKFILSLLLVFIMSCQRSLESRVRDSDATIPHSHREKLIFDYYDALKAQKYADAYKLRAQDARGSLENFITENTQHHSSLATTISIGEETKLSSHDDKCGYSYTVYSSHPSSQVLTSGSVTLQASTDNPEECLIYYNSAFGVHP